MDRSKQWFYRTDCNLFYFFNEKSRSKGSFLFMNYITHLGGATFTVGSTVILCILLTAPFQSTALAAALALTLSHAVVVIVKKGYHRKRPYLVLPNINVVDNPFKDHSFPSGHTTAIFSIVTPFILYNPMLSLLLLPIATLVGISRIFLGLHYPSDVVVGALLGFSSAFLTTIFMNYWFY
ncbi:phosphatase PAP2 family protein [Alkalihalobacterium chitinilyticum]|uniref:Phosphatase PAP2 family protein n=1 Tax=Alkalihalobacterium chitinilyticum TaxID=2980103 RepID=A0ABT5VJQ5_9BACI|nr:phosphatase PAP2 family protein [Alkalihalobacterium chitinilyticum]MDE5415687.1 phosphatase PAP2 family protein [Alkalihalobacterium chitinilyticum]